MSTTSVVKQWSVNFSNKLIGARNKWIIIHCFCVLVDENFETIARLQGLVVAKSQAGTGGLKCQFWRENRVPCYFFTSLAMMCLKNVVYYAILFIVRFSKKSGQIKARANSAGKDFFRTLLAMNRLGQKTSTLQYYDIY